ncbi:MAG: hypothetical protein EA342_06875 [Leptolyngbya sp. LCM1.Bin17]|nr:MAG: hypothetical protein EA342_06875 [Leptolyngbya sp. LCM1.Bin17]
MAVLQHQHCDRPGYSLCYAATAHLKPYPMSMSGPRERISIGDRINRPHEAEGARLNWAEDCCELVISFSRLQAKEIRGV